MNPIAAIESWFALLFARVALRLAPRATLQHLATREAGRDGTLDRAGSELVATFTEVGRVHLLHPPCLERAIALQALLFARGAHPKLCVGLGLERRFPGHAWIEMNDQPIGEQRNFVSRFARLAISPEGIATALLQGHRIGVGDTEC
jgi:hypothetical protein